MLTAATATPALAQEQAQNLLMAGSFEDEGISLRLPAVSPFPLVVGGWGSRGDDIAAADAAGLRAGQWVLLIASAPEHPTHVLQDAPLGTAGFVLRASVQRRRGRQTIALHGEWDRMEPDEGTLLAVELRGASLRVTTVDGSWSLPVQLDDRAWHDLVLRSDPRTGQLAITFDGTLRGVFPGAPRTIPRTVILGGQPGATPSTFRYDDVALLRLPEIELLDLQREVATRAMAIPALDRRLRAAHQALTQGSEPMMAAELRAAARMLDTDEDAAIVARIDALLELVAPGS